MKIFLVFTLFAAANAGLLNLQRAIDIPIERFAQVEQNNNLLPGTPQYSGQRLVPQPSLNPANYGQASPDPRSYERPLAPYNQQRPAPVPQLQRQPPQPQQPSQQVPQKSKGGFPSEILAQVLNSKNPEQVPHIPKDSGVTFLHARPVFEFSVSSRKPISPKKYQPARQQQPGQQPLPVQQPLSGQQPRPLQQAQPQQRSQYSSSVTVPGSQQAVGTPQFNPRNNPYLTPAQPQRLPESRPPVYSAASAPQYQQQQRLQQQQQQQPQQPQLNPQGALQQSQQPQAFTTVTYI
ncbi:unnamed protein product [Allacma fusca]|uniref:Omega gliadin n=1 Tax=Allacma fusca TaxID=39272 RepID=A0A8J2L0X9_9HEXA|nr:unnamed protein product [Allacma fusca]